MRLLGQEFLAVVVNSDGNISVFARETSALAGTNLVEAQLLLVEFAEEDPEEDANYPSNNGKRTK